ncbi:MAG: MFS transporter [Actinobacteria bacterium]|nr:MFS transporter [Actinomycetota bacterium]
MGRGAAARSSTRIGPAAFRTALPYLAIVMETAFYASLSPLLPTLQTELGLTDGGAGLLVAIYAVGMVIGSIPAVVVASSLGPRTAAGIGLGVVAGATAWFALGSSIESLVLARCIQGIGGGTCWCAALAWVVGSAPPERQARVIGAALGVSTVGVLLGPLIGALAAQFGREPVFLAVAVSAALMVWPVLAVAPSQRGSAPLAAIGRSLLSRRVAVGGWGVVITGLTIGAVTVLAPLRLDALGMGPPLIAAVFVVGGVLEAIAGPIAGAFTDRSGPGVPMLLALGIGTVVSAILAIVLPLPMAALLFVVLLPGIGILVTPSTAILNRAVSAAGVPTVAAFTFGNVAWAFGEGIGALAGPALSGAAAAAPYLVLAGLCGATLLWIRPRVAGEPMPSLAEQSPRE